MKRAFLSAIFGVALTGVAVAQDASKANKVAVAQADPKKNNVAVAQPASKANNKARVAVVEFTPGPNAPGMSVEAKRQLQASIAFALTETDRFDVVDVRHTREASKADLVSINGASAEAAVRVGKQLGVSYVLTGIVDEYNTKGSGTLKTRLVEVATGRAKHDGEISQPSTSPMTTGGDAEMKTKVLKPLIEKLTAALKELVL